MPDVTGAVVLALALVAAAAWAIAREDRKLRRRARRYRELELEGIEKLLPVDPYPEEADVPAGFLREPYGSSADPARVLLEELDRVREHTRHQTAQRSRARSLRSGKGAACLL